MPQMYSVIPLAIGGYGVEKIKDLEQWKRHHPKGAAGPYTWEMAWLTAQEWNEEAEDEDEEREEGDEDGCS